MDEVELKRSGQRPLAFEGELLAGVDGDDPVGRAPRWHEVRVYRTVSGQYVAWVMLGTRWAGESPRYDAAVLGAPAAVEGFLRGVDPCPRGIGYPPGEAYADRQARVAGDLRRRYDALLTRLFAALGAEFVERVP